MQALVLVLISTLSLSTYAIQPLGFPGAIKFAPELLSAIAAIYVVFVGSRQRFQYVQPKYWILLASMTLIILCGLVINGVSSGPAISGLRYYLRAIPFFLLPAVWNFTERQIKKQLILLVVLALAQIPLAGYQRWQVMLAGRSTGDLVIGTLEESGALSFFLIFIVLIVVGLGLKKRISRFWCVLLSVLLLIPTTINETKISFLLVPIGLLLVTMVGSPPNRRLLIAGWTGALLVMVGAVAIPIYNYMQQNNPYPQEISLALLTDPKKNYLETRNAGVGAQTYVGRKDALAIPMKFILQDPAWVVFGVGLGNASESSLGERFTGEYGHLFKMVTISDVSLFLLERGLLGTGLFFLFYFLVFQDSVAVARMDGGLRGAIAVGWTGVIVIMAVGTAYKLTQVWSSIAFLFWYVAGLIAARRMQLALATERKKDDKHLKTHAAALQ